MNRSSLFVQLALAGCGLLAPLTASATLFCVNTGDELSDALGLAEVNGVDDEIRIASGTLNLPLSWDYDGSKPVWPYEPISSDLDKGLTISGGWSPETTCQFQTGLPEDTVLSPGSYGSALFFRAKTNFSPGADQTLRGQIAVRNLSIYAAVAAKNSSPGNQAAEAAAIQYKGLTEQAAFTVERVIVREAQILDASNSLIQIDVHGTGTFRLIGNALFDNRLDGDNGGTALRLNCQGGALCYVNNNSIYDNSAGTSPTYPGMQLGGLVAAANNVVADNTFFPGFGVAQAGPLGSSDALDLRNNHFQSDAFVAPGYEVNTRNGDAQWTRSGFYRIPTPGSVLRNSGRNNPFGGVGSLDIAGNNRIREGTVDRGAFERINLPPVLTAPATALVSALIGPAGLAYATSVADPDGNAQSLTYSLSLQTCTPAVADNLFHIAADGKVRLSTGVPLSTTSCLVVAKVSDGSLSTEVLTTVKFNRSPQLTDATTGLPVSTATGSLVHQFSASDDGLPTSALSYSLIAFQGPNNPFTLASNGKLTLASPLPQQGAIYTLVVKACDAMPLCGTGSLVVNAGAAPAQPQGDIFNDGFD
jgi:hypothetical protein